MYTLGRPDAAGQLKPKKLKFGHAAGLREAVEAGIKKLGRPGRASGLRWQKFYDCVWSECGVEPEADGYGARTIRAVVKEMTAVSNSAKSKKAP